MSADPNERPLFPITLYIYTPDGYHDEGIQIVSQAQLNGPGTRLIVRDAVHRGLEVRMTDPDDRLVFHAMHGRILFPPQGGDDGGGEHEG